MMHYYNYYMFGYGWLDFLFMLLFWIAIVWLIVWIIKRLTKESEKSDGNKGKENALEILRKRYAKGEINRKEYSRMKKELED